MVDNDKENFLTDHGYRYIEIFSLFAETLFAR